MGPLGQTHTHKPRECVRGRRTQSSSHLTTEPRYFTPRTPHVHTSRFNKSLHRKSTKSQVKRQIKTKTTDNRVSKHFHCCFKLQPSPLREAHMEAHVISIRRNETTCSTSYMYKGRRGISKDPYRRNTEGRSTHLQTPQCSSLVV